MKKLTLIAFLTATTLSTASAEGMFSMGDMMKGMTDAAKKIKTEITDAATGLKDSVTDLKDSDSDQTTVNTPSKSTIPKIPDAKVTESIDLSKK